MFILIKIGMKAQEKKEKMRKERKKASTSRSVSALTTNQRVHREPRSVLFGHSKPSGEYSRVVGDHSKSVLLAPLNFRLIVFSGCKPGTQLFSPQHSGHLLPPWSWLCAWDVSCGSRSPIRTPEVPRWTQPMAPQVQIAPFWNIYWQVVLSCKHVDWTHSSAAAAHSIHCSVPFVRFPVKASGDTSTHYAL